MQRELEKGPFKATITAQNIQIGGFNFSPGNKDAVIQILGIVDDLSRQKALPPQIGVPPFRVEFNEEGNHVLFNVDVEGDVVFTFESLGDFFDIINDSYDVAIDLIKLQPNNYVGRLPNYGGGDTFDGAA